MTDIAGDGLNTKNTDWSFGGEVSTKYDQHDKFVTLQGCIG